MRPCRHPHPAGASTVAPPRGAQGRSAVGLDVRLRGRQPGRAARRVDPRVAGGEGERRPPTTYAFTFFQLPYGLLAVSIMTTFTPELAESASQRRPRRGFTRPARRSACGSSRSSSLPAGVGYAVLARPLVSRAARARRARRAASRRSPATRSSWFAVGLLGFSLYLFVLRGFYALQDTRTPFFLNVVENVINIVLALAFVGRFGVAGPRRRRTRSPTRRRGARDVVAVAASRVGLGLALARGRRRARPIAVASVMGAARLGLVASLVGGPSTGTRRAVRGSSSASSSASRRLRRGLAVAPRAGGRRPAATRSTAADRLRRMFKFLKRWWKYLTAKLTGRFNEQADPKVQLEQAITEAQDQHRRLKEQAANVIANQKQTEMRLNRRWTSSRSSTATPARRCSWPTTPTRSGDAAKAAEYTPAAEAIANRLIALEKEVEEPQGDGPAVDAGGRPGQGRGAAERAALQQKLAERQKLLRQLDQAKMQEQMNKAMASLSRPSARTCRRFDEVRDKIEARYAKAKGMSELTETSVESRMLEVEQAAAERRGPGPPRRDPRPARPRPAARAGSRRGAPQPSRRAPARRRSRPPSARAPRAPISVGLSARSARRLAQGSTTRSSRWTTSWGMPSGSSRRAPAGHLARAARRRCGPGPWRTRRRRGRRPRPRRRRRSRPARSTTPAGSSERRRSTQRPAGAVVDRRPCPREPTAKAIHSLRAGRRRSWGCTTVPTPADAGDRVEQHVRAGRPRRSPPARPTTTAILAAASFDAMPAAPPRRCRRRRPAASSAWSTSTISSMSEARRRRAGDRR